MLAYVLHKLLLCSRKSNPFYFMPKRMTCNVLHNNLIFPIGDKRNKNEHRASVPSIWKSWLVAVAQPIAAEIL